MIECICVSVVLVLDSDTS